MTKRMITGCDCEYCCSLAGVPTMHVPQEWQPRAQWTAALSMRAFNERIDRALASHSAYLSRRYGAAFG